MRLVAEHRQVVGDGPAAAVGRVAVESVRVGRIVSQPGEDSRVGGDDARCVRRYRVAAVELRRKIEIAFDQADGKQLHDLARVVFVRRQVQRGVALVVLHVGQHFRHRRAVGDVGEQGRIDACVVRARAVEVTERVARQRVVILGEGDRIVAELVALIAGDEYLRQRPCSTLAQLIRRRDRSLEPRGAAIGLAGILHAGVERLDAGPFERSRHRQLLIDPLAVADAAQMCDLGRGRPERGHGQEARRLGVAGRCVGDGLEVAAKNQVVGKRGCRSERGAKTEPAEISAGAEPTHANLPNSSRVRFKANPRRSRRTPASPDSVAAD